MDLARQDRRFARVIPLVGGVAVLAHVVIQHQMLAVVLRKHGTYFLVQIIAIHAIEPPVVHQLVFIALQVAKAFGRLVVVCRIGLVATLGAMLDVVQ